MSYLFFHIRSKFRCVMCVTMFISSLPPVVCRRACVLFVLSDTFLVPLCDVRYDVHFVLTSSCL